MANIHKAVTEESDTVPLPRLRMQFVLFPVLGCAVCVVCLGTESPKVSIPK